MEAFSGVIVLAKTGLLYKMGLAVVAFAMVLLPAIYVGLIVLAAWGLFNHLTKRVAYRSWRWILRTHHLPGSGSGGWHPCVFHGEAIICSQAGGSPTGHTRPREGAVVVCVRGKDLRPG